MRGGCLHDRAIPCDIRRMVNDRLVQPRQIYASTATRRDRRWTSRRGRGGRTGRGGFNVALVSLATLVAALTVLAAVAPGLS